MAQVFISHNEFGSANPKAMSTTGNEITFDMDKVSEELKSKVYGKCEVIELTQDEMNEILKAKRGSIDTYSQDTINRILKF